MVLSGQRATNIMAAVLLAVATTAFGLIRIKAL
jgi:hypothetical protein